MGAIQKFGVQDMRHVIFDNGTRMAWIVAFDTDWDPYVDDAVALLGIDNWLDFLPYIEEYTPEAGQSSKAIKDFLQIGQAPASGFSRTFPNLTVGQIRKAERSVEGVRPGARAAGCPRGVAKPGAEAAPRSRLRLMNAAEPAERPHNAPAPDTGCATRRRYVALPQPKWKHFSISRAATE